MGKSGDWKWTFNCCTPQACFQAKQNWVNLNCHFSTRLQKNGILINISITVLLHSQNVSAGKASLPVFFLPRYWWVPDCPSFCGWDSGVISFGLVSLLHVLFLFRCCDFKEILPNLHQCSKKIDALPDSVLFPVNIYTWRLKQNSTAYYTTPFDVNLDLLSYFGGAESGFI